MVEKIQKGLRCGGGNCAVHNMDGCPDEPRSGDMRRNKTN